MPKLAPNGILIFNDYTYWSPQENLHYGVVHAVNELCLAEDWRVLWLALGRHGYSDIAITRR